MVIGAERIDRGYAMKLDALEARLPAMDAFVVDAPGDRERCIIAAGRRKTATGFRL